MAEFACRGAGADAGRVRALRLAHGLCTQSDYVRFIDGLCDSLEYRPLLPVSDPHELQAKAVLNSVRDCLCPYPSR